MRIVIELPTKVATAILDYITAGSTQPEVVVKVRLAPKRDKPQPPRILWEVELLPNNGGVYRKLLQGGDQ